MKINSPRFITIAGLFLVGFAAVLIFYGGLQERVRLFSMDSKINSFHSQKLNMTAAIRNDIDSIVSTWSPNGTIRFVERAFTREDIDLDACHALLHLAGHYAYQYSAGNLERLLLKDSDVCSNGFQHGVEAQIVVSALNPRDTFDELKEYCAGLQKIFPKITCYHGAGHEYMRMSLDPRASLEFCNLLAGGPATDPYPCYRGVFSEYRNLALGYDSETGLQVRGEPLVHLDMKNPYSFCQTFAPEYQKPCFGRITKVLFDENNVEDSFRKCLVPYSSDIQKICVGFISLANARKALFKNSTVETPSLIFSLEPELKKAYLKGAKEPFVFYKRSGVEKDWQSVCKGFTGESDALFCAVNFGSLQNI